MTDEPESPAGDSASGAVPPASEPAETPIQPSLRERLRPLELLGISAVLAVFAGGITLLVVHPWGAFAEQAAHNWMIVLVVFGAAFVLSLVVLAMLALGGYEPPKDPPSNVLDREPPH